MEGAPYNGDYESYKRFFESFLEEVRTEVNFLHRCQYICIGYIK